MRNLVYIKGEPALKPAFCGENKSIEASLRISRNILGLQGRNPTTELQASIRSNIEPAQDLINLTHSVDHIEKTGKRLHKIAREGMMTLTVAEYASDGQRLFQS